MVTASGHVVLMDAKGNVAFADHVVLTDQMRDGALDGFGALIGKTGRLAAAKAHREEGRVTTAIRADYTPCKICSRPASARRCGRSRPIASSTTSEAPHRVPRRDDRVVRRAGAYTPYMSQPDPTVRYATGILTPDVGKSTTIGYFLRLPIYISLSPSQDATVAPLVTTHGGEVLEGEYRERWNNGGMWLQGAVGYNPNGGLSLHQDQFYAHLFGSGRTPIDNVWPTGFDAQLTSDQTYLRRYDISFLDRLTSDLFLEGESGRSRFPISGYFFQGLRPPTTTAPSPYRCP